MEIEEIKKWSEQGHLEDALAVIQKSPEKDMLVYRMLEGEILYKLQRWGEALNLFEDIYAQHNNKEAKVYCQMIQNILGFYNPDLLNP
ncbi:hypothetical protein K5X82_03325 [Halosquirtibacter xylanolyticus]|uniref:hypothetical protein n=1 Tax=Halosquirtibacter xylanolyticus TaxID=3374599 RepID=UPI003747B3EA|nr:hypothetical protein K5X82_03325 [Prolixibacteraceae bacterium]